MNLLTIQSCHCIVKQMKKYVLIVSESEETISFFENTIQPSLDYNLLVARSICEAKELLSDENEAVFITFIESLLENRPGLQLLKELRKVNSSSKIIMILNTRNITTVTNYMKTGAFDCITKPFSKDEINYKINQCSKDHHFEHQLYSTVQSYNHKATQTKEAISIFQDILHKRRVNGKLLDITDFISIIKDTSNKQPTNNLNTEIRPPTLLLIEDEADWQENLSILLEPLYNVYIASTAMEGLNIINNNQIDIVLLDIQLPDQNGLEVLGKIKENNKTIEVILVTAFDDMSLAIQAIRNGAFDYINKPYADEELLVRISKALEKKFIPEILTEVKKQEYEIQGDPNKKLALLKELSEKRLADDTEISYEDICIFFPELTDSLKNKTNPIKKEDILTTQSISDLIKVLG